MVSKRWACHCTLGLRSSIKKQAFCNNPNVF
jgi:hypothetical protein